MYWADFIGAKYIHGKLEEWTRQYGGFFKPCYYLAERAAKGIPLVSKSLSLFFLEHAGELHINILLRKGFEET
jgi:hypothetical protein